MLWIRRRDRSVDLQRVETTRLHRARIANSALLRRWYRIQYGKYARRLPPDGSGAHIELGSGGGFLKEVCPRCITSSYLAADQAAGLVDRQLDAQAMSLESGSADSFFLLDVLHHLEDPEAFFRELARCLKPGGFAYIIEPAATLWGRFLYENLHEEGFDRSWPGWGYLGSGPDRRPNQAAAHIIFERDREAFVRKYPQLVPRVAAKHTFIAYGVSGGLSFEPILPAWAGSLVGMVESCARPLSPWLATYMDILLTRT
ncbi:MAG: class I SAM-dependent methyltransferase [Elusimicrobiota bacterium]|jgi:SAM-dependent methyltransferase